MNTIVPKRNMSRANVEFFAHTLGDRETPSDYFALTSNERDILRYIAEYGPCSRRQVSEDLGKDYKYIHGRINRLYDLELLEISDRPKDEFFGCRVDETGLIAALDVRADPEKVLLRRRQVAPEDEDSAFGRICKLAIVLGPAEWECLTSREWLLTRLAVEKAITRDEIDDYMRSEDYRDSKWWKEEQKEHRSDVREVELTRERINERRKRRPKVWVPFDLPLAAKSRDGEGADSPGDGPFPSTRRRIEKDECKKGGEG
ncbi:MAG: winged helix-turn-helix transcriptional regulator [Nitrososphaerota archaeon]|nr:winged helix-turn-helix transcriptional regulator [Nitrososphaerota archaeon]